jgi:hypothetical protein
MTSTHLDNPAIEAPHRTAPRLVNWRRRLLWMVIIAFVLRLVAIGITHQYKVRVSEANFGFGWEMGRIAKAIATGEGFSSPFTEFHTGPTAWEPPVYPYLTAGVFKVFGIYTRKSAFVLLVINSLFSALTCIPLFYAARRMFGLKVAKWTAWTWALFPYAMYWAVKWIWETSITQFLLVTLLLITLQLEETENNYRRWVLWGFLWGFVALVNPSVLSVLPFFGLWLVYRRLRRHTKWFVPSALAAVIFFATISPWLIRNYETFGKFVFIRSNFGAEFRMGNGPKAEGLWMFWLHPSHNKLELQKYRDMGELAYVAGRKAQAMEWIHANPGQFAKITFRKFVYYWADPPWGGSIMPAKNWLFLASSIIGWWGLGLALKHRKQGAGLLAALFVAYPAVYYFVFPHPRYRAPIEPVLLMLAVYLISETREGRMTKETLLEMPTFEVAENTLPITTLSVIIPCYNEKNTIRRVVDTVVRAGTTASGSGLVSLQKEIVIVDDCSADGTRDVLAELEREFPSLYVDATLKLYLHEQNQGKGAAVRTGIKQATGGIVIVQDADLEYDPRDFPVLLEPILTGRADAVFGNRFHGGIHRVLYFWHYQANRMLTLFCNMLSDLNLSDMEVGYKAFRREIFDQMTLKANRFGFEPEVTIKTAKLGCRIYEVPISYHGRTYDEGKKIGWKDGVAAMWHMFKYRFLD